MFRGVVCSEGGFGNEGLFWSLPLESRKVNDHDTC